MRLQILAAAAAFAVCLCARAAPASDESIENLLTVTRTEAMMDSMHAAIDGMMRQSFAQASGGRPMSAEQKQALEAFASKFAAILREEMSWQKMKPQYVQLYRETFDQSEIDGMLAFCATPAGRAMIDKMPVVMQKSMALSQSMLQSVLPRMTAAMDQALKDAGLPGRK